MKNETSYLTNAMEIAKSFIGENDRIKGSKEELT